MLFLMSIYWAIEFFSCVYSGEGYEMLNWRNRINECVYKKRYTKKLFKKKETKDFFLPKKNSFRLKTTKICKKETKENKIDKNIVYDNICRS